jgi:hypothetical protein
MSVALLRRTAGSVFKHDMQAPRCAGHNIRWFGDELAGEEGFEPSIS